MKVQTVSAPTTIKQVTTSNTEARARAIAAFNASATTPASAQPVQQVVQNQTAVSPEEMTAIATPTAARQTNTNETITASQEETPSEVTEAPKVETKTEDTQDPELAKQFAQLARQEKALRSKAQQQETSLKAREDALKAREAELAAKDSTYKSGYIQKDLIKQDPLSVLAEAGVSYEDLTQQILSQQPVDPRLKATISKLENEIRELKSAQEKEKQTFSENQTQQYQAAVKQIEYDAKTLVNSDPIAFEAITKTGAVRDVVKLIEETYKQDGILLSVEEAAQQVEDYLVEENYKLANKIEKIKRKMQPVAPAASTSTAQTSAANTTQQPQQMKTLTNAASSSRQLSARERAILAFKGELATKS